MNINYEKILSVIDYTLLEKNDRLYYVDINGFKYAFYLYNNLIKAFSFTHFRNVSVQEFFEAHLPYSDQEKALFENFKSNFRFVFREDMSEGNLIGYILKLKNIANLEFEEHYNKYKDHLILDFINDFKFMTDNHKWFISENKMIYFIKPGFLLNFNSATYNIYSEKKDYSFKLKDGDGRNVMFLNPYTMFEYYSSNLPGRDRIFIGHSKSVENPKILIRSTKSELINVLDFIFDEDFYIKGNMIQIHFREDKHSVFYNEYHNILKDQIKNEINNFNMFDSSSLLPDSFKIKSKRIGTRMYPVLEFETNITIMNIILYILKDRYKYDVENINFSNIISINDHQILDSSSEVGFDDTPNEIVSSVYEEE